jgi:hypothetical protein
MDIGVSRFCCTFFGRFAGLKKLKCRRKSNAWNNIMAAQLLLAKNVLKPRGIHTWKRLNPVRREGDFRRIEGGD